MSLADSVPIIDIAALVEGDADADVEPAVSGIARACREWGFFQVVNHGVSDELIAEVWHQTRRFFARPRAVKESILRSKDNPWGYYNNELTKNQRDKKEVFDYTTDGEDAIYHAENRWLAGDTVFRETMLAYLDTCADLSWIIMRAFCLGLGLQADYLEKQFARRHTGFTRLNYFPVEDPLRDSAALPLPKADLGIHHHTDAGVLTVLMQDDIGGLQVHRDGCWHDIPPVEGAFVINTADMMQVWSNDQYYAAIHRVLAMQDRDRYSIPFFFNPPAGAVVAPMSSLTGDDRPARYRAIDWSDFRGRRTDGDYANYGTEVQISQYRK